MYLSICLFYRTPSLTLPNQCDDEPSDVHTSEAAGRPTVGDAPMVYYVVLYIILLYAMVYSIVCYSILYYSVLILIRGKCR